MQVELNFNLPQVLVPIICPTGGGGGSNVHDIIQNESNLQCLRDSMDDININLKFRNDNILFSNTHSINYLFHISFSLKELFYGEYIVHIYCQCERGDSYKDSFYMFYESLCISHRIFSVLFRFSVPFSVPRFSNTPQLQK